MRSNVGLWWVKEGKGDGYSGCGDNSFEKFGWKKEQRNGEVSGSGRKGRFPLRWEIWVDLFTKEDEWERERGKVLVNCFYILKYVWGKISSWKLGVERAERKIFGNRILFSGQVHLLGREGIGMWGCVEDHLRSFILSEIKLSSDCEIIFGGENSSNSPSGN